MHLKWYPAVYVRQHHQVCLNETVDGMMMGRVTMTLLAMEASESQTLLAGAPLPTWKAVVG